VAAIERALDEAGLRARTVEVAARPASRAELERVHTAEHLDALDRELQKGEGWLDSDTYFSAGSREAALYAAGATIELATRVASGELDNGIAIVRPPGHHATRERSMGFCLLNNIAAAAAALEAGGARVAIFDWDVHHGNGTEEIFAADPNVLYVSMHEWPQYPGTGPAFYTGEGAGLGATLNVPLAAGTDGPTWIDRFHKRCVPVIEAFRPEVILVSAGFDAHREDPLGGLRLEESTYDAATRALAKIQPRIAMALEGGYHPGALARSTVRVLKTLLGDP
jgi:acetoin utilization deacetylase AcuC-like enzyme